MLLAQARIHDHWLSQYKPLVWEQNPEKHENNSSNNQVDLWLQSKQWVNLQQPKALQKLKSFPGNKANIFIRIMVNDKSKSTVIAIPSYPQ